MLPDQEATDDASLSISEAVAAYTQTTDEADNGQSEEETSEEGEPLETETEGNAEGEDEQTDEEGQPEGEEAGEEEEAEGDDTEEVGGGRFAGDDAKVRLPDGTVLTVAQLKSGNLMDRDYRQKTMALSEERKAFEAEATAVTQTKTQLAEQQDYMSRLLQSMMPQPPQRPTVSASADPVAWLQFQEQQEAYNNFAQHLQYIQQQQESSKSELTAKQQEELQNRIKSEFGTLLEKAPELKDQQKLAAFEAEMIATGAAYGFTRDDIAAQVPRDHRMALVLRDAMAWRKLQASKANVQDKTPNKRPPVQKGGKRQTPGNIQQHEAKAAMDRLGKTGSLRDGVAAYLATQKQG